MMPDPVLADRYAEGIRRLVEFAETTTYEDIPAPIVRESRRCLLDFAGTAIGASSEPAVQHVLAVAHETGGAPQATVLADGSLTSVLHAALVNGVATHVLDFDDTHAPTILHGTGPITAAALAVGEWTGRSGRDLLVAHAVAFELAARVALALYPGHYDTGWHMTGTAGTFGAATAAARMLSLAGPERWRHLIGIAATQAAGHREQFGAMTKSLHAGKAASNGTLAALLARRGMTASASSFGGRRGMVSVMGGEISQQSAAELDEELGDRWELARNGFKPYACGVVQHAGIDAVRELVEREGVDPHDVSEIRLLVHPLVIELTSKPAPTTGLEGKFSIAFACAIAMLDGAARERQFTDANVARADVIALRDRILPVADDDTQPGAATAIATLRDGRAIRVRVEHATGTPENPLSDDELLAKYHDLADAVIGEDRASHLAEVINRIDQARDLSAFRDAVNPRA